MKFSLLMNALLITTAFSIAQSARATELTDQMALEEGMTPIEELSTDNVSELLLEDTLNILDDGSMMDFNRPEYVTTFPSQDDIARVVKSHRQVIVINKAVKGGTAQTLQVFQNGVIKQLNEDGVLKDAVKISTGREKQEKAKSGRVYLSTTPKGFFRPQRVYTMYYSNTWKADMPNAIFVCPSFFKECGIAIHATTKSHYAELGTRASGGCVRTKLEISRQLRELVMDSGLGSKEGQFKTTTESHRRWKVINNGVQVDNVDRNSGGIKNEKIKSWDTVIVVYE